MSFDMEREHQLDRRGFGKPMSKSVMPICWNVSGL